jgi:hypothetical protein
VSNAILKWNKKLLRCIRTKKMRNKKSNDIEDVCVDTI